MAADNQPEFCLLMLDHWATCMPRSDWAAWAQGLFSVVAIGVAIWVPYRQRRLQELQEERSATSREIERLRLVDAIAMDLVALASEAAENFASGAPYILDSDRLPDFRARLRSMEGMAFDEKTSIRLREMRKVIARIGRATTDPSPNFPRAAASTSWKADATAIQESTDAYLMTYISRSQRRR